jgi:hypothetical protein
MDLSSVLFAFQFSFTVYQFLSGYKYFRLFSCLLYYILNLISLSEIKFGRRKYVLITEGAKWVDKKAKLNMSSKNYEITDMLTHYIFYDKNIKESYVVDLASAHFLSRINDPSIIPCNKIDTIFPGVRIIDEIKREELIEEVIFKGKSFEMKEGFVIVDFRSDEQLDQNLLKLISIIPLFLQIKGHQFSSQIATIISVSVTIAKVPLYHLFNSIYLVLKSWLQYLISLIKSRRFRVFVFEFLDAFLKDFMYCDEISAKVYKTESLLSSGRFRLKDVKSYSFITPGTTDNYLFVDSLDILRLRGVVPNYCRIEVGDKKYVFNYRGDKICVFVHEFEDNTFGFYCIANWNQNLHLFHGEKKEIEGMCWILEKMCETNSTPCEYFKGTKAHASKINKFLKDWCDSGILFESKSNRKVVVSGQSIKIGIDEKYFYDFLSEITGNSILILKHYFEFYGSFKNFGNVLSAIRLRSAKGYKSGSNSQDKRYISDLNQILSKEMFIRYCTLKPPSKKLIEIINNGPIEALIDCMGIYYRLDKVGEATKNGKPVCFKQKNLVEDLDGEAGVAKSVINETSRVFLMNNYSVGSCLDKETKLAKNKMDFMVLKNKNISRKERLEISERIKAERKMENEQASKNGEGKLSDVDSYLGVLRRAPETIKSLTEANIKIKPILYYASEKFKLLNQKTKEREEVRKQKLVKDKIKVEQCISKESSDWGFFKLDDSFIEKYSLGNKPLELKNRFELLKEAGEEIKSKMRSEDFKKQTELARKVLLFSSSKRKKDNDFTRKLEAHQAEKESLDKKLAEISKEKERVHSESGEIRDKLKKNHLCLSSCYNIKSKSLNMLVKKSLESMKGKNKKLNKGKKKESKYGGGDEVKPCPSEEIRLCGPRSCLQFDKSRSTRFWKIFGHVEFKCEKLNETDRKWKSFISQVLEDIKSKKEMLNSLRVEILRS